MKILTYLDLNQNELRNVVLQSLVTPPDNAIIGQLYYNSTKKRLYQYNGEIWETVGNNIETGDNGLLIINDQEISVYKLPIANNKQLGGIKVGNGLTIDDETGVLSVTDNTIDWTDINNKPDFKTVATSGSYNDLINTPSIPSKLSELTNDSNFVTDTNYVHTDNNFTNENKTKLSNIAAGAEVNVQSDWTTTDENEDSFIKNKPTKLSEFTNDSAFIDNTVNNLVNYYTKNEVSNMINTVSSLKIEVVSALPAIEDASSEIIYLVNKGDKWTNDIYNEYLFIESTNKFELIGNTAINLTNYLQKDGDGSAITINFETAESYELPISGETISIIVSKITKYITDLSNKPTVHVGPNSPTDPNCIIWIDTSI